MEFKVEKDTLQRSIMAIEGIVNPKNTVNMLSNILVEALGDYISLTTTDLEIGIKAKIKCAVVKEGKVAVPSKKFSAIIKSFSKDLLTIKADENHLVKIKAESRDVKFDIMGVGAKEFPFNVKLPETDFFKIDQSIFKNMLQKTLFAVANDETRYIFNGIYIETLDGFLRFVATDGRRLSYVQYANNSIVLTDGVIVPSKIVFELFKMLRSNDDMFFAVMNNQIFFIVDNVEIACRLIQGTFPDYQKVIPREMEKEVELSRDRLIEAVQRVSLMASEESHQIKIDIGDNKIIVSAKSPDIGFAEETIDVAYDQENTILGFNSRYLLDSLKAFEKDEVVFKFSDAKLPTLLLPKDDDNMLNVIMPVNIT